MAKSAKQKLKLLYIAKMLYEETDDEHGLTTPQIIQNLAELTQFGEGGIEAERKSIYDDLEQLREFGLDIITRRNPRFEHAIGERPFEYEELMLLVDSVRSSRFLTEKKSSDLVDKLKMLTSKHLADSFDQQIHVAGRIKMQNESVYYNVDAIQNAMRLKRQVRFKYFKYDINKKAKNLFNDREYCFTIVALTFSDGYYYVVVYDDCHKDFAHYRVDRIRNISVSDLPATRNKQIGSFDIEDYTSQAFGMFKGESIRAYLLVDVSIMSSIIDRFGKSVTTQIIDESKARIIVDVMQSPPFFAWLTLFGDQIKIEKPSELAHAYQTYLKAILKTYKN